MDLDIFFKYGLEIFYPICCSRKRNADASTLYIKMFVKPIIGPFNLGQSAPKEVSTTPKEEPSTLFQRQRVDMLLAELVRQFPLPVTQAATNQVILHFYQFI